jgi:hypothetical protein
MQHQARTNKSAQYVGRHGLATLVMIAQANRRAEDVRWLIEPLHAAGFGPARIAMTLNNRRQANPGQLSGHGGSRWNRETVVRTLRRLGLAR